MRRWLFSVYRPALSEDESLVEVEAEDSYHAVAQIMVAEDVVGWDFTAYPDGTYSQPLLKAVA